MIESDSALKTILFYGIALSLVFLAIALITLFVREARKDAEKKKKAEALMLKPDALIPGAPNVRAIEEAWKQELLTFASTYVDQSKNCATADNKPYNDACQMAAQSSVDFWSLHDIVMNGDQKDRDGVIRGMKNRIDDLERARRRLQKSHDPKVVPTDDMPDIRSLIERADELRLRFKAAHDLIDTMQASHPCLVDKAKLIIARAGALFHKVEQDLRHAQAWTHDDDLQAYFKESLLLDLKNTEIFLGEPAELLAAGERDKTSATLGLERLHALCRQVHELKREMEQGIVTQPAMDIAGRLLALADEHEGSALDRLEQDAPKNWHDLERRIWHAVAETELALWTAGKTPVS